MNPLPGIGIRLHGGLAPRACVELAQLADECGFSAAWFAENAFGRGILPAAAACAAATRRIRIGAGVFNPFSRHPTMMAMEVAALDELSGGRVAVGIGAGIGSAVEKIGFDASRPLPAVRDTVAILRALLEGGEADHEGKAFVARRVRLEHPPRAGLPILIAGRGEMTVRFAGSAADGLIVSNMCAPAYAARSARAVQESRIAAGRPGRVEIVQYMPCAVDADGARARAQAKRAIAAMLPGFWSLGQRVASAREALLEGTGIEEAEVEAVVLRLRAGEDPAAVLDDRYAASFSLSGTPEACLERATALAANGINTLALTFEGSGAHAGVRQLGQALRPFLPL